MRRPWAFSRRSPTPPSNLAEHLTQALTEPGPQLIGAVVPAVV
ncbi:MAG: hypothetical protein WBP81_13530 [Solirubrobacteraceae bacterium]